MFLRSAWCSALNLCVDLTSATLDMLFQEYYIVVLELTFTFAFRFLMPFALMHFVPV